LTHYSANAKRRLGNLWAKFGRPTEIKMKHFVRNGILALSLAVIAGAPLSAQTAEPQSSAVVVMYHRFGESVHPSTNISLDQFEAHLAELSKPQYNVLPIPEIITRLKAKQPLSGRTVGISIDDAFLSVYAEAFPRLKKAGFPFTLFVATNPVDRRFGGYMSWDQIRELKKAGATIGSQTHTHLHMASTSPEQNRADLQKSNERFRSELGEAPTIIAYPYGEFSLAVGAVAKEAGYATGFGQHSGVLHPDADMAYLPRFAMNENFGGDSRFRLAVNALPLNVFDVSPLDPMLKRENNPPLLGFTVNGPADQRLSRLACYASGQGKARLERLGSRVEVRLENAFPSGRARINCTMPTREGRWHWYGLQFYVPKG
jgi:peptidoglycan/xylan/chitin deacetylase (PgdA/CDA1 family)